MVNCNDDVSPTAIESGEKVFAIEGGPITVSVSLAVFPSPPLVELTVPVVLTLLPAVAPVTVTLKLQLALDAIEPPLKAIELGAVTVKVPPHSELVALVTVTPAGNVSVNATPVSAVPLFEFVMVNCNDDASPTAIESEEKVFAIEGGPIAVTVSEPVLFVSSPSLITSSESTVAVFARLPAVVGVAPTVTVKLPVVSLIVTVAPLASQVSTLLPSIAQPMLPELVMSVKLPVVGDP